LVNALKPDQPDNLVPPTFSTTSATSRCRVKPLEVRLLEPAKVTDVRQEVLDRMTQNQEDLFHESMVDNQSFPVTSFISDA